MPKGHHNYDNDIIILFIPISDDDLIILFRVHVSFCFMATVSTNIYSLTDMHIKFSDALEKMISDGITMLLQCSMQHHVILGHIITHCGLVAG